MENNHSIENEIYLKELFKIIWGKKFFIIIFTAIVTTLGLIHVFTKTPVYEVKSVVRIGYINKELLEESKILEKKLQAIFNVGINNDKAIVLNIKSIKTVDDFLEITTQSFSNEMALSKNKEVISFLQNEYKGKIEEYIFKTKLNIKNLEQKINYIENVDKKNIEQEVEKLKMQSIFKIDEKIRIIKTQELPSIEARIQLIKKVELQAIENKIMFNRKKLEEYGNSLKKISKIKLNSDTQNMLMIMQTLNNQNLMLNIENQIENLIEKKEKLKKIDLQNLEVKKKNLLEISLNDLNTEKENLINEKIRKLEISLNIDLKNRISNLKDKIQLEKLNLSYNSIKNSEVVGDIKINKNPIKPKKKIIVIVSFITGFILSLCFVFFMQFIRTFNRNENK